MTKLRQGQERSLTEIGGGNMGCYNQNALHTYIKFLVIN